MTNMTHSFPFLIAEVIQIFNHWVFDIQGGFKEGPWTFKPKEAVDRPTQAQEEAIEPWKVKEKNDPGMEVDVDDVNAKRITELAMEQMGGGSGEQVPDPEDGESREESAAEEDQAAPPDTFDEEAMAQVEREAGELPAKAEDFNIVPTLNEGNGADTMIERLAHVGVEIGLIRDELVETDSLNNEAYDKIQSIRALSWELVPEIGAAREQSGAQGQANVEGRWRKIINELDRLKSLAGEHAGEASTSAQIEAAEEPVVPAATEAVVEQPAEPEVQPQSQPEAVTTPEHGITLEEIEEHRVSLPEKSLAFQKKLIELNVLQPKQYMDQFNRASDRLNGHLDSLSEALATGKALEIGRRQQQVINALVALDDLDASLSDLEAQGEAAQLEQFRTMLAQFQGVPWMGQMAVPAAFLATRQPDGLAQIAQQLDNMQRQIDALQNGGISVVEDEPPAADGDEAEDVTADPAENEAGDGSTSDEGEAQPLVAEEERRYQAIQEKKREIGEASDMEELFRLIESVPDDALGLNPLDGAMSHDALKENLIRCRRKAILQIQKGFIGSTFHIDDLGTSHIPISKDYGKAVRIGMTKVINGIIEERNQDIPGFDQRFNAEYDRTIEERVKTNEALVAVAEQHSEGKELVRLMNKANESPDDMDNLKTMWRDAGLQEGDINLINKEASLIKFYTLIESRMGADAKKESLKSRMTKGLWTERNITEREFDSFANDEARAEYMFGYEEAKQRQEMITQLLGTNDDEEAKRLWGALDLPEDAFSNAAAARIDLPNRISDLQPWNSFKNNNAAPNTAETATDAAGSNEASGQSDETNDNESAAMPNREQAEEAMIAREKHTFERMNLARDVVLIRAAYATRINEELQQQLTAAGAGGESAVRARMRANETFISETTDWANKIERWHTLEADLKKIDADLDALGRDEVEQLKAGSKQAEEITRAEIIKQEREREKLQAEHDAIQDSLFDFIGSVRQLSPRAVETIEDYEPAAPAEELSEHSKKLYAASKGALKNIRDAQNAEGVNERAGMGNKDVVSARRRNAIARSKIRRFMAGLSGTRTNL